MRVFVAVLLAACVLMGCTSDKKQQDALESARQAYAIGHFSEAERIYQHYIEAYPEGQNRWEAWNRLVDISVNVLNDYEKAANMLDSVYLEFGDDPKRAWELLSRLAEMYEAMHRYGDAVRVWKRALSLPYLGEEQRGMVYLRIAKTLRFQQEFSQCDEILHVCVEESEQPNTKALCLYESAQGLDFLLRRAQAQQLGAGEQKLDLSALQQRLKNVLETIRALQDVDAERKALATFLLADLLESQGKRKQARELFASIRETYPNPMVVETRLEQLE